VTWWVQCERCGTRVDEEFFHPCRRCGAFLEVRYDLDPVRQEGKRWLAGRPHTIWGYGALLPDPAKSERVSIGEGDTPLVPSQRLWGRFGRRVLWKNETVNPTWSHKDRYQAVAATMARDLGFLGLAGTSTGNHGIAAAAYASAAGLRSILFYPPEMSSAFLYLTGLYGGQATVTGWDARAVMLDRVLARPGWCPIDGRNPFGIEGYKTIAFEIVRDLRGAPDLLLIPVGSGKLLTGIWRGFEDLRELGFIRVLPRIVACQATGVDVLSDPLAAGSSEVPVRPKVHTVALSTQEPTADPRVLEGVRATGGRVVALSEGRIMAAIRALGREGIAAEPASALSAAAVERLLEEGEIPADAVSVCLVTASLTKTPHLLPELSDRRPWRIGADGEELGGYLATMDGETSQDPGGEKASG
jgi:threonine synthase